MERLNVYRGCGRCVLTLWNRREQRMYSPLALLLYVPMRDSRVFLHVQSLSKHQPNPYHAPQDPTSMLLCRRC
jgi:hypothetical protein